MMVLYVVCVTLSLLAPGHHGLDGRSNTGGEETEAPLFVGDDHARGIR